MPTFAFAILGFMGSLLSLLLDETSGKPMKDELNNANRNDNMGEAKEASRMHEQVIVAPNKVGPMINTTVESIQLDSQFLSTVPSSLFIRSKSI